MLKSAKKRLYTKRLAQWQQMRRARTDPAGGLADVRADGWCGMFDLHHRRPHGAGGAMNQ
jgi:hypothetical protein